MLIVGSTHFHVCCVGEFQLKGISEDKSMYLYQEVSKLNCFHPIVYIYQVFR